MVCFNLFLIAVITVNIIDLSGFVVECESGIWRWVLKRRVPRDSVRIPKPFSCSYCMTWWVGLVYLLISGNLGLGYLSILLVICFLTPVIGTVEIFLKDLSGHLMNCLYRWLKIE